MLLPSDRHKESDLRLWKEIEEADFEHGEILFRSNKWQKSIEEIRKFHAKGECYCSVSWGKDSVVVAHLVQMSGLPIPLANIAQHGTGYDPHIPDVRDYYWKMFPKTIYYEETVSLTFIPDDGKHSPALDEGIKKITQRLKTNRYIGGVRAAESGIRKVGIRTRGLSTSVACQPIGWWTARDVFGWLAYHQLPVHPNYAMLGGGRWNREQIRVSTIGGPKGTNWGRSEWEREYYGDILKRLEYSRRIAPTA